MCLIAVAYRANARYSLIVAANRDERHARPTAAAHWWPRMPEILGGRDEAAGGSWLALDRAGRFAAVTNRPVPAPTDAAPSRGGLVVDFLSSPPEPGERPSSDFERELAARAGRYAGFNLLLLDGGGLRLVGNSGQVRRLEPGIHALSNDGRDCRWPKVIAAKRRLEAIANAPLESPESPQSFEPLFALLADRGGGQRTDVDYREAAFIVGDEYGTRSSTVVLIDTERNVSLTERSFDVSGRQTGESAHVFTAAQSPGP